MDNNIQVQRKTLPGSIVFQFIDQNGLEIRGFNGNNNVIEKVKDKVRELI